MKDIVAQAELVACCGLYCGACGAYLRGRCPGCRENRKASWCKVRTCCQSRQYATCADCQEYPEPNACRKFNNLIARLFGLVFRSDRAACIRQIRTLGVQGHADAMSQQRRPAMRK